MLRTVKIASPATLRLVPLLVLASALTSGWVSAWRALGVPAMLPRFILALIVLTRQWKSLSSAEFAVAPSAVPSSRAS